MEHAIYLVTLVGTALVVAAAFSSLIAFRFGAPLLLLFLCIGLATGTDGLGIEFDNARLAYFAGSLALAVILFDSGFGTPLNALRQAAGPALSLATFGVLLTTGLFGAAAYYLLDLSWLESFLLGAAVASTDAAAVFFLLRAGEINLRERVRSTLEVESGTNDPIAIFLTITLVEVIAAHANPETHVLVTDLVLGFVLNMGLGAIVGVLGGLAIVRLVDRLNLDHGLLPIFVLTLSLMVFAAAGAIGGSGFLAVYLAGLIAGNSDIRAVTILKRFQDGMSWLAQIIMFLMLGLFATPSQFPAIMLPAIAAWPVPDVRRPAGRRLALPDPVPPAAPRDRLRLLGRPARRGLHPACHHAAARRTGERPRHLQHRLHHRAGVAGGAGLDGRAAGAPARPDRAGATRTARQGRARTAGLGPSRASRLPRRARQPGGARRAHPALGAALAGAARRPLDALPGHAAGSPPATRSTSSCPTAIRACSTGCSPAAPWSTPRTPISSAPSPSIRRAPPRNWKPPMRRA